MPSADPAKGLLILLCVACMHICMNVYIMYV